MFFVVPHVRSWPKADMTVCAAQSAFGGKADIEVKSFCLRL
jgi:hypothetical protein